MNVDQPGRLEAVVCVAILQWLAFLQHKHAIATLAQQTPR
jgi:hypothetical protein